MSGFLIMDVGDPDRPLTTAEPVDEPGRVVRTRLTDRGRNVVAAWLDSHLGGIEEDA